MKKVLIITPRSPFQGRGADEQDRLAGIEWFVRNGFEVEVVTKTLPNDLEGVERAIKKYSIPIHGVPYKNIGKKSWKTLLKRLANPLYWDGAAYEYFDLEIQALVRKIVKSRKPDLVWFDYTYLWPLYHIARAAGIPIVTRSINFEPEHFLDEDGHTLFNRLRALPKYLSERRAVRGSSWFFAITPNEEKIYAALGRTPVRTLPLRSLPTRLVGCASTSHAGIRLGFMPSTYTVSHNREALRFIIEDVWPLLPDNLAITLHVTGNKFPENIKLRLPKGIVYEGFVPSSIEFWQTIDIALSPSLFGAGMQQKIFEPIALGLPTITSARGLAGYPFLCGTHLLCAETKEDVAQAISKLTHNLGLREHISDNAQALSRVLFAQEKFDLLMNEALNNI